MAKGWTTLTNVNTMVPKTYDIKSNDKAFKKLMTTTKSKTIKELIADGNEHYKQKLAEDDALLDAFENKRLKNKDAIKRAMALKKEREAAAAKKNNKENKENATQ